MPARCERLEQEVTAIDLQGAEAIKLYTTLLKAYPDYPRNDQVLYQLARAYETTGQPEQALATLDRIVAAVPAHARTSTRCSSAAASCCSPPSATRRPRRPTPRSSAAAAPRPSTSRASTSTAGRCSSSRSRSRACRPSAACSIASSAPRPGKAVKLESLKRADRELVEDTLRVMSITFSYNDGATTARAVREAARRAPVRVAAVLAPGRPVRRKAALPGCRHRLPRLRGA